MYHIILQKCLTFMDRGYVFKLINSYMDKFNPGDPKTLYDYKFVFLQIICSHEHYIAFNLPLLYPRLGTTSRTGELPCETSLCHRNLPNFLNPEDRSLEGCDVTWRDVTWHVIRHHIPGEWILQQHRCEILTSHVTKVLFIFLLCRFA